MNAHDELANRRGPAPGGRLLSRTLAVALLGLGVLPIANWIAAGHAAPWYGEIVQTWLSGTLIIAGVTVVLIVLSRRRAVSLALQLARFASQRFDRSPHQSLAAVSIVAACVYAAVAQLVFDGRPLFIDEIVQLYQARLFAEGRISEAVGPFPEFFSAVNVVTVDGRQFGQFPPGGPAHLLLGVVIGAPWLITPLLGGAAVYVFGLLVRRIEPDPPVALGAVLLLAFSPFMIFMAGSHMNHVPSMLWVLVAWFACARLTSDSCPRFRWALLFGFAAALAATIRPVDAVAMTLPAAVICLWSLRAQHMKAAAVLLAMCVGSILPAVLLLAFNAATTGSPFLFGYELLWGKSHSLGFHASPWGVEHSPARGLELLNLYTLRLQSYLFETPSPSLIPVIATLAVASRSTRFDRAMLWAVVLLAAGYFAYWHDGFYLGPRFFFVLLPVLVLLAARAPRALGQFTNAARVRELTFFASTIAILIGIAFGVPERARYYTRSLSSARHQLTAPVDSLGIRDALIFVRESWGSQVMARLWGRQIGRTDAERLYRGVDTCVLDSALTGLELQQIEGPLARSALWPLLRDSASVQPSTLSPDRTERIRNGSQYSGHCLARVALDHQGIALYPLVLGAVRGSNVFARDLGSRNSLLTERYPNRRTYLLTRRVDDDSVYELHPLAAPVFGALDAEAKNGTR